MAKGIRSLLDTVMQALPQVGNLGLLFYLLFFIFAALGVELFGRLGKYKQVSKSRLYHLVHSFILPTFSFFPFVYLLGFFCSKNATTNIRVKVWASTRILPISASPF